MRVALVVTTFVTLATPAQASAWPLPQLGCGVAAFATAGVAVGTGLVALDQATAGRADDLDDGALIGVATASAVVSAVLFSVLLLSVPRDKAQQAEASPAPPQ